MGPLVYVLCSGSWVVEHFKKLGGDVSFKNMEKLLSRFVC
jgi:hypothetical protein